MVPDLPKRLRQNGTALTVGVFDGVHLGHQELLRRAQLAAARHGLAAVAMTFSRHPLQVLAPAYAPRQVLRPRRKFQLLSQSGLHHVVDVDFSPQFASLAPEEFFSRILVDHCAARHLVCGTDFRFGRGGTGDIALLRQLARQQGSMTIEVVDDVVLDGVTVRSTAVREAIAMGEVCRAASFLSRPHEIAGRVVQGLARGREIGFPTANLVLEDDPVIPQRGVYLTAVRIQNGPGASITILPAMTNIGFNPTFGLERLSIETHILQYEGNLVDHTLEVFFLARLRDEQKFSGVEALRQQLHQDKLRSETLLADPAIRCNLAQIPSPLDPA